MAHIVKTYDPKKVVMTYTPGYTGAEPIIFTAFVEGSIISLERIGDVAENAEGAQGDMDRVIRNANSFSVMASLKQTSPTTVALEKALVLEMEDGDTIGTMAIGGLDGARKAAGDAFIVTDPKKDFNRSMSGREWKFTFTNVQFND